MFSAQIPTLPEFAVVNLFSLFRRRLRAVFRRDQLDSEMVEEMRTHLELLSADYERRGLSAAEARHAAQREFGNLVSLQARTRDARDPFLVRQWAQLTLDIRFGLRQIAKHPWFAAAVIAVLALGIGVNTTVFTLVNAVLFKPVPLPGGANLVAVRQILRDESSRTFGVSLPEFREYRAQNHTFAALEACARDQAVLSDTAHPPERCSLGIVSSGLFEMLHTPPILGRGFTAADDRPGAPLVVLLGYETWQTRFGGASDVIGRTVRLNREPAVVVGVMPTGFKFPNDQAIWIPLIPNKTRELRTYRELYLYGLLKPGAGITTAQGDLTVIATRSAKTYPDTNKDVVPTVQTLHEIFNGGTVRLVFLLTLGAVGCVLLIACANVANLMLSRSVARRRELAIRAAMGASRWQIMRQLLVECTLLGLLGGMFGLALSHFGVQAFDQATQNVGRPFWIQFTMDWRAFGYFALLSGLSGSVFGLAPALRASRVDLNAALKEASPGSTQRGGRLTGALVVFQFALTVILLTSAGLMIRGFFAVQHANPFIPADHLLTARISLPDGKGERYETPAARRHMHDRLQMRLAAIPGVTSAVLASDFPGLGSQTREIEIEGRPAANPKQRPHACPIFATTNYLSTIGLPLLEGRGLAASDGESGHEAAVVTRSFAAHYWPDENPLGHRFRFFDDDKAGAWITIVGVCGDVVQDTQDRNSAPVAYLSNHQEPWAWLGLMLRTTGDPATLARSVRSAVQELDPDLPIFDLQPLPAAIARTSWFLRVFGTLFFIFAAIALTLASVGIYAVIAQSTALRTREIGIRMALGATASGMAALVLRPGIAQLGLGLALGLGGALASSRLMDHLVGLISPQDPVVFGAVLLLLAAIGLFACWLPARRAARVDPLVALRCE